MFESSCEKMWLPRRTIPRSSDLLTRRRRLLENPSSSKFEQQAEDYSCYSDFESRVLLAFAM